MARRKTRRSRKSQFTLSDSGCRDKSGAFVPVIQCLRSLPKSMQVSGINKRRKTRKGTCRDSRGRFVSKARCRRRNY